MHQLALHPPKLNPLVLPSQTAVLFAMIVLVFLAAALSGAIAPRRFASRRSW